MKLILVTGSGGQLGSEIKRLAGQYRQFDFVFTDIKELDITSKNDVAGFFSEYQPFAVINCAAYTAVDRAETEPDKAMLINAEAVRILAENCKAHNSLLIHVSTDYVFDGTKNTPYTETDMVNPVSAYGKSKLAGEKAILDVSPRALIIRTSWLYSSFGGNFVKTILRYARERGTLNVVNDQYGSPTYAADLAGFILDVIPKLSVIKGQEIVHYSNEGTITWYEFARAIIELKAVECTLHPVSTAEYPTPAARPGYSVFAKNKIKSLFKPEIPFWKDSLKTCLSLID